jgi:hypothetical protein
MSQGKLQSKLIQLHLSQTLLIDEISSGGSASEYSLRRTRSPTGRIEKYYITRRNGPVSNRGKRRVRSRAEFAHFEGREKGTENSEEILKVLRVTSTG